VGGSSRERQWAMEGFLTRLDELRTVLGPAVGPSLDAAKAELAAALAARDRGDGDATKLALAKAMASIAALGDHLDAQEGALMRGLAGSFIQGMARGDRDAMETTLDSIQERTGTPKKTP
jgi:hypothetical protein